MLTIQFLIGGLAALIIQALLMFLVYLISKGYTSGWSSYLISWFVVFAGVILFYVFAKSMNYLEVFG